MDCICPVCQKKFCVLWPTQWALKVKGQYYCSWTCLRADEKGMKEEVSGVTKVPEEAKKKAIQAALNGDSPYEFLAPFTKNPKAMWTYLKGMIKKKDPELYAKIPDLRNLKKVKQKLEEAISQVPEVSAADAMAACQDAADEFFGKCEDMGLMKDAVKGPVTPDELYETFNKFVEVKDVKAPEDPKICQPVVYDGMTVREVEGLFGRYRRSDVGQATYIDLEFTECCDVISNTVEQWRSFVAEFDRAALILGVEL